MRATPTDWPSATRDVYRKLQSYEIVGASSCVAAIVGALRDLAESHPTETRVVEIVAAAGEMFSALKPDTAAYSTAARWLVRDLEEATPSGAVSKISSRAEALLRYRDASLARLVEQGVATVGDMSSVLVHDWSSSVLLVLEALADQGQAKHVYVTWGQPLDKGPAVARRAAEAGHTVTVIPDTAIGRTMADVGAVLSGVETLYGDGSCANTVGTYPIALVAAELGVPFYGVTECIKIDPHASPLDPRQLTAKLLHPWREDVSLPPGVQLRVEVLDLTPADVVTGYVTERGVLAPAEVGVAFSELYAELDALAA